MIFSQTIGLETGAIRLTILSIGVGVLLLR